MPYDAECNGKNQLKSPKKVISLIFCNSARLQRSCRKSDNSSFERSNLPHKSVFVGPGAIELTLIPLGANSTANVIANSFKAALLAL